MTGRAAVPGLALAQVVAAKGGGPNPFGIAAIGVAVIVLIILVITLRR
jgi:hypothetical protein